MKTIMNITNSLDDMERYRDRADLAAFYQQYGCSGLELMHMAESPYTVRNLRQYITPDMVIGLHACCIADWMQRDRQELIRHYRRDLEYARDLKVEYVVFHVTQVNNEECLTYQMQHEDEEVVDAAISLINELLDGEAWPFYFLMENLWWPGLNFLRPEITGRLLDGIHYEKKGLMLDTGHFMNTNRTLRTPGDALTYLHAMLDQHEKFLPMIRGIHLHQSFSGAYLEEYLKQDHPLLQDEEKQSAQAFSQIFRIDQHQPFAAEGVRELVERIDPQFLTYEYITENREEHARYLAQGSFFINDFRRRV